jgi:hypothetical protein
MQQEQTQEVKNEILHNNVQDSEQQEKVELFLSSVRSRETKIKYSIYLKKYMKSLEYKTFSIQKTLE